MENNNKKFAIFGLILGLSLIISTGIGAFAFYKIRTEDSIATTGSAKKIVISNKVKWSFNITRSAKASTIKDGYIKLDVDLVKVKEFLASNGVTEETINVSPIMTNERYDQNANAEKNYDLVQNISIQSNDVQKISDLAKNISSLVSSGNIIFSTTALEYYYSKLPETRVELLADAVADAKSRAEQLAKAGGKKIGVLKSASSGVVQVLEPNSVEVNDYGMYNTSSINKEIMVTVKASFEIK